MCSFWGTNLFTQISVQVWLRQTVTVKSLASQCNFVWSYGNMSVCVCVCVCAHVCDCSHCGRCLSDRRVMS